MTGIVAGMLSDCLSVMGIPTGTASAVLSKLINKRHDMLREIILCEMRQGNFKNVDQDDFASVLFRLIRDAEEGVAKNNLRLLARVVNGMAEKNELKAPNFLRYASVLSSLSDDEIIVLGVMAKFKGDMNSYRFYQQCEELGAKNSDNIQQALLRTGLVAMEIYSTVEEPEKFARTNDPNIMTHADFSLTPLMDEILEYTDFMLESDA